MILGQEFRNLLRVIDPVPDKTRVPPFQASKNFKMLVHGVEISTLEGWMIKFNHKPSIFGQRTSRRWFKVAYVAKSGGGPKLELSYSTTKTAKDPRGWLLLEDVSAINCRKEMIELVTSSRTLRLKGETAVEHRLWSDSLYQLCTPPPNVAVDAMVPTRVTEPHLDRARAEEKGYTSSSVQANDEGGTPYTRNRHVESRVDECVPQYERTQDEDEDEDEDRAAMSWLDDTGGQRDERSEQGTTSRQRSTRSVLVALIKAGRTLDAAPCTHVLSDSEDEEDGVLQEEEMASLRARGTSVPRVRGDKDQVVQAPASESHHFVPVPVTVDHHSIMPTLKSSGTAANIIVPNDWDAGEDDRTSMYKSVTPRGDANTRAPPDANFAHDDWDA